MKLIAGLRPESFSPPSDPSVKFELAPLTAAERLDVIMSMESSKKYGQAIQLACEYAIRGWSGVVGDDETPIPFSRDAIKWLPMPVLLEVGTHAVQISRLGEDEKKASDSRSA